MKIIKAVIRNFFLLLTALLFHVLFSCAKKSDGNIIPINPQDSLTPLKAINNKVLIGSFIVEVDKNAKYAAIAEKEFNAAQALWYAVLGGWPSQFTYGYANPDASINWMTLRGIIPQVHMLVGPDGYMPDWLKKGTWTVAELDTMLKNLIYKTLDTNDNKNKVAIWNVANELFNDDGTYRTDMVWNKMGWEADQSGLAGVEYINTRHPLFVRRAFQYCRDKTSRKLEYRDFNIENNNPIFLVDKKHKAVFQLLKHMQQAGIPVDAVGIQGHYAIGKLDGVLNNDELKKAIQHFKSLGLEVNMTELDISASDKIWNDAVAQQQKKDYYNVVKQVIEAGVSRLYFWGIQDLTQDGAWRSKEHPLLWDENLNKKPAYYGVQQALIDTK